MLASGLSLGKRRNSTRRRAEYGSESTAPNAELSVFALAELRRENSVSSSQPSICVTKHQHSCQHPLFCEHPCQRSCQRLSGCCPLEILHQAIRNQDRNPCYRNPCCFTLECICLEDAPQASKGSVTSKMVDVDY